MVSNELWSHGIPGACHPGTAMAPSTICDVVAIPVVGAVAIMKHDRNVLIMALMMVES